MLSLVQCATLLVEPYMLLKQRKKHLRDCSLDPALLGSKLGRGAGHIVFAYGNDLVVKIPFLKWVKSRLSVLTADDAKKNIDIVKERFEPYILNSEIHCHEFSNSYCITQNRVFSFSNLRADHIVNDLEIAKQFSDILSRNQKLLEEKGYSLDFFGQEGCIKTTLSALKICHPQMANLLVAKDSPCRIYIADSQLFEVKKPENERISRRMMAEASRWGFLLNKVFAKSAFGEDIGRTKRK